jgi:hypothetical protein
MRLHLALACILILCGCVNKREADLERCLDMEGGGRDECLLNASLIERNLEVCGMIGGKKLRDECIKNIAVAKADPGICGRIMGEEGYAGCITSLAVKSRNPYVCQRIHVSSGRDACSLAVEDAIAGNLQKTG